MITPIIMCGGVGSRLWPLSTTNYPKQFLKFFNNDKSLLQITVLRFLNKREFSLPVFLTNLLYVDILKKQLSEIGLENPEILVEPCSKNNAPAIAISALYLKDNHPNNIMLIVPSDSYIENSSVFLEESYNAFNYLKDKNHFILFGIKPTYPETGFGYIKAQYNTTSNIKEVESFFEKPTKEKAEDYVKEGYLWNSGMFMVSPQLYLDELKKYEFELYENCHNTYKQSSINKNIFFIDENLYQKSKSISIDYAIIEKTKFSSIIKIENVNWTDVGSWKSVYNLSKKDENGNVFIGNVKALNCKNCYVYSESSLIAICDIENQIIINANNQFLNVSLDASQDIKLINK